MDELDRLIIISRISVCILMYINLYSFIRDSAYRLYKKIKGELTVRINKVMYKNTGKSLFSYHYQKKRLDELGVTYYSGGRITPLVYLLYKLGILAAVPVILIMYGIVAVIPAALAWWGMDIYYKYRNENDNKKMSESIMTIYDTILLQVNAGEYITQVLIDAYRGVSHPRLKAALVELTGDIICSNDLKEAVNIFSGKFKNENINNLVILINHLMDNGITADMIKDIKKNLESIQQSYNRYERERTEHIGNACAIAMFVVIMAIMAYASMLGLGETAELFRA